MKKLNDCLGWFAILLMAVLLLVYTGGCGSHADPGNPQPIIDVQKAAQNARDTVALWQAEVAKLQAVADALHASLDKLPPDVDPKHPNPTRKVLEKELAAIEPQLATAQLWLGLARLALDVFAGPAATQPSLK